ncbi:hypothetical protein ARMGADRAFT_1029260 [Armillaria gallica]|uniref:Uncharacterized protein n=1 Tax=Armillaria gallica TaxID=47427 RepID=A0A2H3E0Q1_ARMGA|nr:hypothetical protein ARMGADRAFT_1029260 [Armillaria gallica]
MAMAGGPSHARGVAYITKRHLPWGWDVWLEAKMISVVNVVPSHACVCMYTSHHKLCLHSLLAGLVRNGKAQTKKCIPQFHTDRQANMMVMRRKQDAYHHQNAKTASMSVFEIYGETVKNCKNTKIKNMHLKHHTTVKLEIDRVDLSSWEEKCQEWRICRHEDRNLTSHAGNVPDTFATLKIPNLPSSLS